MDRETVWFGAGAIALLLGAFAIACWLDSATCAAQTRGMTLPHQWGLMSGCMVHDPRVGWIPLDNYRVID